MMLRHAIAVVTFVVASMAALGQDSAVQSVNIKSSWGGLGEPRSTEISIRNEHGTYRVGQNRVDASKVQALVSPVEHSPVELPSVENLGIAESWLREQLDSPAAKRSWWMVWNAPTEQQTLFRKYFTDLNLVRKVLPNLYSYGSLDSYPKLEVTILHQNGLVTTVISDSVYEFMLPWSIRRNGQSVSTYNREVSVSIAALMPLKATNQSLLAGSGLAFDLADAVMQEITDKQKTLSQGRPRATGSPQE